MAHEAPRDVVASDTADVGMAGSIWRDAAPCGCFIWPERVVRRPVRSGLTLVQRAWVIPSLGWYWATMPLSFDDGDDEHGHHGSLSR
jgi:hypothetical protein